MPCGWLNDDRKRLARVGHRRMSLHELVEHLTEVHACQVSVVDLTETPKLGVGLTQQAQQLGSDLVTGPLGGLANRLDQAYELVARLPALGRPVGRPIHVVDYRLQTLAQLADARVAA